MEGIKCKICHEVHAGRICTKFGRAKAANVAQGKAKAIAARPVKLGSKGKAKKAKQGKK